ncbi:MAG: aspartate carbamoyltransferase regulatory subunit [Bacteroidetes bacterium]|uniref:Aspartate carbamoyltransferase regulatory chain n=1 Tax=Candidatus Merdivivens pullistercoris TaxID=2840873 RepID=A0A9D9I339_9BACT|nr:aspartate carbamoyltransferase regulatory subunit [Candidatus Merdivivens pullistercoris]
MEERHLVVTAIKNGTVLDHIPADQIYRVMDLLELRGAPNQITIGINLESKTFGKKGIIKIADRWLEDAEVNRLALVAPNATINIIRDFKVTEKKVIRMPKEITGIAKCNNPKCITNHEPIRTKFTTVEKNGETFMLCHYCEKMTPVKNIKIISGE